MQIEEGHITGFLGPNGSGKTTTFRMLCGLLTPDSGAGQGAGSRFPREAAAIKRQTGYMTQRFSLYEDLTIEENLTFIARVYGLDRVRSGSTNRWTSSALPIAASSLPGSLSGGWKQRLALAAAVLHEPKLLLLDEPTAGVDPQARRDFWDEIHRLADEGMTVLVSTHYMDEAERCHEIAYIFNGTLIARGTSRSVIAKSGLSPSRRKDPAPTVWEAISRGSPGSKWLSPFGPALHVSGRDRAALERRSQPYRRDPFRWTEVEPSLEDVFIDLMHRHTPPEQRAA